MLPLPILLPFFALIALGYALGRGPLAAPAAQNGLRIFVLYAALPAFIFRFVVEAAAPPPSALLAPMGFALAMLATAATVAVLASERARALAAMGSISANVGYMGLPAIAVSPLGADPAATGAAIAILVIDVLGTMNANMLLLTRGGLRAGAAAMLRAPLVWAMGVPASEMHLAGQLMGTKTILNEFIAYLNLAGLPEGALSDRSTLIMVYALCGFANFGSVGILIGGLTALVPSRRHDIVTLGTRAIVSGTLATSMTGAVKE